MTITVSKARRFEGKPLIPGDKSISHRALIFGAISEGVTSISGLSLGEDVQSTARCLEALGVRMTRDAHLTRVYGEGRHGLKPPTGPLDCGNSGTTMRTLMGLLCAQDFSSVLIGDDSLSRRPMRRVAEPLIQMGASISLTSESFAPMTIRGTSKLKPIDYELKTASAQLKTAIMLAALYANGMTRITGKVQSRDHTERLLKHFGAHLDVSKDIISIQGGQTLQGVPVNVWGDPSSAAFWLAGACIVNGSSVEMDDILLNETRLGFIRVLERMGAPITCLMEASEPEPKGRISLVGHNSTLKGITVTTEEIPFLIDEIPLLSVLGAYAHGVTEVRGAEELRVKETDRIEAVAKNLRQMGGQIETFQDGFRIHGPQKLKGAEIDSFGDHRIAMAFSIAALGAQGDTIIHNAESVEISYPNFFETLRMMVRE